MTDNLAGKVVCLRVRLKTGGKQKSILVTKDKGGEKYQKKKTRKEWGGANRESGLG